MFLKIKLNNPEKWPSWPEDFTWSSNGKPDGYNCIKIQEPLDTDVWKNNYFCWKSDKIDPGITWRYQSGKQAE